MATKKDRRHSGWITPISTIKAKRSEIINECLEPQPHYSDWDDYRDSQRSPSDKTKLRKTSKGLDDNDDYFKRRRYNKKIKREIKIRKVRKKIF